MTPQGMQPGSPAGSYALSGLENINLYNGNLNLHIPLLKIGGRGAAGYTVMVSTNTKNWQIRHQQPTDNNLDTDAGGSGAVLPEKFWAQWRRWNSKEPGYTPGVLVARRTGVGTLVDCFPAPSKPRWRYTLTRLTFIAPDGTETEFRDKATNGRPILTGADACRNPFPVRPNRGRVFLSTDGSFMTFVADGDIEDQVVIPEGIFADEVSPQQFGVTGTLYMANGVRYRIEAGQVVRIQDSNGNIVENFTDALNRTVNVVTGQVGPGDSANPADSNYRVYDRLTFAGLNGEQREIRVYWTSLANSLRPDFTLKSGTRELFPEIAHLVDQGFSPAKLLSKIVLPDGRSYDFFYNSYAEVARVVLPTGGAIEYDMTPGSGVLGCDCGEPSTDGSSTEGDKQVYRRLRQRRVYRESNPDRRTSPPEALEGRTEYSEGGWAGGAVADVKQFWRRPDGGEALLDYSRHYFSGYADLSLFKIQEGRLYSPWDEGREVATEQLDPETGGVLRRVDNEWVNRVEKVTWLGHLEERGRNYVLSGLSVIPASDPFLKSVTTRLEDGRVSKQEFSYDQYNNRVDVYDYDYDYGPNSPGGLIRRAHADYVSDASYVNAPNDSPAGAHLRNLPRAQWVSADGAETGKISYTSYEYDNYSADARHAPLVSYPEGVVMNTTSGIDPARRGNVTGVTRYAGVSGASASGGVITSMQYDVAGNLVGLVDANGNSASIGYQDSYTDGVNRHTFALPTSVTTPVPDPSGLNGSRSPLTSSSVYDYSTGLIAAYSDENGVGSLYGYGGPLDRLMKVVRAANTPAQSQTMYGYDDVNRAITAQSDQNSYEDNLLRSVTFYDGLGRTVETRRYESPGRYSVVEQRYDALGRPVQTSSPYCPQAGETPAFTATSYDGLGRVSAVTTPDGASVYTLYDGARTLVTDQAGRQRISAADALGRITSVWEVRPPDPAAGTEEVSFPVPPRLAPAVPAPAAAYRTSYTYDALGNLRLVKQGGQPRFFMYDSLGRLLRVKNPEQDANPGLAVGDPVTGNSNWSAGYEYDGNGNLRRRVDARGVAADYTYDALDRNKTVRYSDGTPGVDRVYDNEGDAQARGRGRLWLESVTDYTRTPAAPLLLRAVDGYDFEGRPRAQRQHFISGGVLGEAYATERTYDLAGHVTSVKYPSGHIATYAYDSMGRLSAFAGDLGDGTTRPYSSGISYNARGQMSEERLGTDLPLYHKLLYNARGQLWNVRLSTLDDDGSWNRGNLVLLYGAFGPGDSGPGNNGNVSVALNYIPTDVGPDGRINNFAITEQRYAYDALNRLTSVAEHAGGPSGVSAAPSFRQSYDYDRWGNRTVNQAGTTDNVPKPQFEVELEKNRLFAAGDSGRTEAAKWMRYDAAGNLTYDKYTGQGSRHFDGENRVTAAQDAWGQVSTYLYDAAGRRVRRQSAGQEVWQVYGVDGELVAEYAGGASPARPLKEYGYRGGELLVTAEGWRNVASAADGARAVASSTYDGNYPASAVIDGDRTGRDWGAGGGWNDGTPRNFDDDSVEVSFGGSRSISEVDVYTLQDDYASAQEPTEETRFGLYGVTDFEVRYWADKIGWVTIPEVVTGNDRVKRRLSFPAVTTSKIRVVVRGAKADYSRITEIEAYQAPDSTPGQRVNLAAAANGGAATASTAINGNYPASAVIDGDRKGRNWGAGGGWNDATADDFNDEWVQVSFAAKGAVDEVDVFTLQDDYKSPQEPGAGDQFTQYGITDFLVQYWDDTPKVSSGSGDAQGTAGVTEEQGGQSSSGGWVTVRGGQVQNSRKVWARLTFPPVATKAVRVRVLGALAGYSRVTEVEAYGTRLGSSAGAGVQWLVSDHLGTPRVVVDRTGSLSGVKRHDYLPFGEELYAGTGGRTPEQGYGRPDGVRQHFTGYERDYETGLDFAGARYYSAAQGRFTSIDPLTASGRVSNPRSWNRYTYVLSNPLNLVDPLGLIPQDTPDKAQQSQPEPPPDLIEVATKGNYKVYDVTPEGDCLMGTFTLPPSVQPIIAGVVGAGFKAGWAQGVDMLEAAKYGPQSTTAESDSSNSTSDGRSSSTSQGGGVNLGPLQGNGSSSNERNSGETRESSSKVSGTNTRSEQAQGVSADRQSAVINNNAVNKLTGLTITVKTEAGNIRTKLSAGEAQTLVTKVSLASREEGMRSAYFNYH